MVDTVSRTIRITTRQEILPDVEPAVEGFPVRKWSIEVHVVGASGELVPATIFDRVTYKLHPTFEKPTRVVSKAPFRLEEQGWGEFDIGVVLHTADRGGDHNVVHDLNFQQSVFSSNHELQFPVNRPNLARLLAESGPVPGLNAPGASGQEAAAVSAPSTAGGEKRRPEGDGGRLKKRAKALEKGSVDLEMLAAGLQKLNEDDLLGVVQMVTDNKTPEMYVKNDVDEGEFHMDLFTLPDSLLKSLWDYVKRKTE